VTTRGEKVGAGETGEIIPGLLDDKWAEEKTGAEEQ
jgi:hypothetical protein